jgi:hypothetical protein
MGKDKATIWNEILRDVAEYGQTPFYWTKVHDDPKVSAPSGWYQWQESGLVYLGEKLGRGEGDRR